MTAVRSGTDVQITVGTDKAVFRLPYLYGVRRPPEPLPDGHRYRVEGGPTHRLIFMAKTMGGSMNLTHQPGQEVVLWFSCPGSAALGHVHASEYCLSGDRFWRRCSMREAGQLKPGERSNRGLRNFASRREGGGYEVYLKDAIVLNSPELSATMNEAVRLMLEMAK